MRQSLTAGRPVSVVVKPTIADALVVACPGRRGFKIVEQLVNDVVTTSEEELVEAVCYLFEQQKLIVEPGGAAAVAALRAGQIKRVSQDVVCILSGANIPPAKFLKLFRSRSLQS